MLETHTLAYWRYLESSQKQFELITYTYSLAQHVDKGALVARTALDQVHRIILGNGTATEDVLEEIKRRDYVEGNATLSLKRLRSSITENVLVRLEEIFECFLSDVLTEIYFANPQMLKSKEFLTFQEALQFETKEELIRFLLEKRISSLHMSGIRSFCEYVTKNHQFDIFDSADDLKLVEKIIAVRNLIVHRRGKIDYEFLRKTSADVRSFQKQIRLDTELVFIYKKLSQIAEKIDIRAFAKFQLKLFRHEDSLETDEQISISNVIPDFQH